MKNGPRGPFFVLRCYNRGMRDKRKARDIIRAIDRTKKRVEGRFEKKVEKNQHLFSIIVPIVSGLLFLILAVINLKSSIYYDESYIRYAAQGNVSDILSVASADGHSPLFYLVIKAWSSVFGTGDTTLRFMSVFFGLISIVFIFQLVKKWFGIKAASMSTLLVAVSPIFIRLSQEVGVYTLLLLSLVVLTYVLSLAIEKGEEKSAKKYWFLYAIMMAFSLWLNYLAVLVIFPQFIYILFHFGGVRKFFKNKNVFKYTIETYAFGILLFVPRIIMVINNGMVHGNEIVSLGKFFDFVSSVLFYNDASGVTGWGVVFGVSLVIVAVASAARVYGRANDKDREKLRFVIFMTVAPLALLMVISIPPFSGVFEAKNLLFSVVAIWVFFGITYAMMKDSNLRKALLALIVVVACLGVYNVENRKKDGYISEILVETFIAAKEDEPIIIKDTEAFYDGFFYSSEKHKIYHFEDDMEGTNVSTDAIKYYKTNLIENRDEFLKEHESVWYVIETPPIGVKYEIPKWAENMRIESEISLDHHTALEFSR